MSVFEISFSFFSEFSLPSTLVLSLKFSVLSVLRGFLFSKTFVCFVSWSVFEISFSFPLEFSLSSSLVFSVLPGSSVPKTFFLEFSLCSALVLSLMFSVLSVLRGSLFPKTLVCLAPEVVITYLLWMRCYHLGNFFRLTKMRSSSCLICHLLL